MVLKYQAAVYRQAPDTANAWYLRSFTTFDLDTALDRAYEAVRLDSTGILSWERILYLSDSLEDEAAGLDALEYLRQLEPHNVDWTLWGTPARDSAVSDTS